MANRKNVTIKNVLLTLVILLYATSYTNKNYLNRRNATKYLHKLAVGSRKVTYIEGSFNSSASRRPLGINTRPYVDVEQILATNVSTLNNYEIMKLIGYLIDIPTAKCNKTVILGGKSYCRDENRGATVYDGYKSVCLSDPVRPIPKNCVILSFGVGNEFSFDDAAALYGCKVFSFDFTMKNWTHKCYGAGQHFVDIGLGTSDIEHVVFHAKDMYKSKPDRIIISSQFTLETILKIYDLSNTTINILKMDIEGFEWEVFVQIFKSASTRAILRKVDQIVLEIHFEFLKNLNEDYDNGFDKLVTAFEIIQCLYEAGYRLVNWIPNSQSKSAVAMADTEMVMYKELHFIKNI